MSDLVHKPKESWDAETKLQCAVIYADKGTYRAVHKLMPHVPVTTIRDFSKDPEWLEQIALCRSENSQRHIAVYDQIVNQATDQVLDKLPEASARDAMIIAGVAQDKSRILMSLPNQYSGDSDSIKSLQAQFIKLSQSHKNIQDSVVSVQGDDE